MTAEVWAYPTTEMQCNWLGERVATVNVRTLADGFRDLLVRTEGERLGTPYIAFLSSV